MANSKNLELGIFLKARRENQTLSQIEVSQQLGYESSQFISNWERGLSTPPIEVVKKLSVLYKIPGDTMFNMILECTIERITMNLKIRYYGKKSV